MASATEKTVTPLLSVTQLIQGLLQNQNMTMKELVNCLMSEPYGMQYTSMGLIVAVLNSLKESGSLRVFFLIDKENRLAIEPVFYVVS